MLGPTLGRDVWRRVAVLTPALAATIFLVSGPARKLSAHAAGRVGATAAAATHPGAVAGAASQPAASVPQGIAYERDIEYGTGGGQPLRLDLARPE
ncbi:MAG: hypothetical protein ACKOU6_16200, partial [Planctomycetota bacterium]